MGSRYQSSPRNSISATHPNASGTALGKLFRFYSECVDAEDRQQLTFKLTGLHRSFISPWANGSDEPLLTSAAIQCQVAVTLQSDLTFLQRGVLGAGAIDLFYGYPVILDTEDFLTPLFFIQVESSPLVDGQYRIRVPDPSRVLLNRHIYRKARFSDDELQEIQKQLEGGYGSFEARLRDAAELLGISVPLPAQGGFVPFPRHGGSRTVWLDRAILFRSERSNYTAQLRHELEALARYERLQKSVDKTALGALLDAAADTRKTRGANPAVCQIVPLNDSQLDAAQAALRDRVTVITGPPGTGKSQVIVDVLATCARDGRSVLFASKNNKAVDVVSERLAALLGADDWTLRLGNAEYVDKARAALRSRLSGTMPAHEASSKCTLQAMSMMVEQLEERRAHVTRTVDAYRAALDKESALRDVLPRDWIESGGAPPAGTQELHRKAYFEALALTGREPLSFWLRVERLFAPQRQRRRLAARALRLAEALGPAFALPVGAADSLDGLVSYLARTKLYFDWLETLKLEERLAVRIENLETTVTLEAELRKARQALSDASIDDLALAWTARVRNGAIMLNSDITRYFDANNALRSGQAHGRDFLDLIDTAVERFHGLAKTLPIWIVTALSTRRGVPLSPALFDIVVIDEASQCDIASAIPLLYRAKSAVIIGDPKQLRHISSLDTDLERKLADDVGARNYWDAGWKHASLSLYDLAECVENGRGRRAHFLREHYRSDASIIGFSNRVFYSGQLVVRTDRERLNSSGFETGVFWHDVRGAVPTGSRSAYNPNEITAVVDLIRSWASALGNAPSTTIGVVTPFRRQMEGIEAALLGSGIPKEIIDRVRVGTAHRFQGDESDVIVFSPVVAEGMLPRMIRWVSRTDQLLNVAITRARAALHVVGDLAAAKTHGGTLGDLANYITGVQPDGGMPETEEERRVATLLAAAGLHFRPQVKVGRYRIDFEAISPFGNRWAIEVDGRQHYSDEMIDRDASRDIFLRDSGYLVARISNRDVREAPERVRSYLQRLY